jgi:hypothetical protein
MTRGVPVIEALLDSGIPYTSGPEWLAREVLRDVHVLGVAGTHGKTTTSSMLAWILEHAGLNPGFLIGGVPGNFSVSARLGGRKFFVIEADEYDTAFFDKRAKFVHYRSKTLILNNLEFDHADIYENLAAIKKQFHHLVRTVPASGRILWNAGDENLNTTLAMGAWTPLEGFARAPGPQAPWSLDVESGGDFSKFVVLEGGKPVGTVKWNLLGGHNAENALAAIGAARHAGVSVTQSIAALAEFKGVKRRMELRGEVRGISVYDDFAHHPTAIASTIDGLRRKVGGKRIVAGARAALGHDAHGRAPRNAGAFARRGRFGVDVRAAGSRLGCRCGGGHARFQGRLARSVDELVSGPRGQHGQRRPGAHHEQRRLRRSARQTTRGVGPQASDRAVAWRRRSCDGQQRHRPVSVTYRAVSGRPAAAAHLRNALYRHGPALHAHAGAVRRRVDPGG